MTHKCEYCDTTIKPCASPCLELKIEKDHVCCTCNQDNLKCELPERIVCAKEICNLKFKVDWYKRKFTEAQNDKSKLAETLNEFRIINIGAENAQRLIKEKDLNITGIKIFWSKRSLTWDAIPPEIGYEIMLLHEEGAKKWAEWINQKTNLKIKKQDLIDKTEAELKKTEKIRNSKSSDLTKTNQLRERISLNPKEKLVLHHMKTLGMSFEVAVNYVTNDLKMPGDVRKIEI